MAKSKTYSVLKIKSGFGYDTNNVATKIFDRDQIKYLLEHYKLSATNLIEICKDAYWEVAEFIAKEAIMRAPIDTGTMERAIYARPVEGRGRYSVYFGFDWSVPYPTSKYKDGRTTGKVFNAIHDLISPTGGKNLGELSWEKQAEVPAGIIVGGGFMTRAITENEEEINKRLHDAVHRGLAEMGVQKKKYIKKRGKMYRVGVDDGF